MLDTQIEHINSSNGTAIKVLTYIPCPPEDFNLGILNATECEKLSSFKSIKRKCEFYYTRLLWKTFGINQPIQYNTSGRPYLKKGNLSISHSRNIIAIGYHPEFPIGIDVEYHSEKITKIKHKFISEEDEKMTKPFTNEILTLIWSIKEAVYKMEQIDGLSFKEHIHVEITQDTALVKVKKGEEIHRYSFEMIDYGPYVLTYCSHANLNGKTIF